VVSAFLDLKESASEVKDVSEPIASEASLPKQAIASEVILPSEANASIGKIEPKPLEKKFSKVIEAMLATAAALLNQEGSKIGNDNEASWSGTLHEDNLQQVGKVFCANP
jgi:hypothetical protein